MEINKIVKGVARVAIYGIKTWFRFLNKHFKGEMAIKRVAYDCKPEVSKTF